MTLTTPKFTLPLIAANQAQKDVTHNEAVIGLETLAQLAVVSRALSSPPLTSQEGEAWIVASGATSEWEGFDQQIALWISGWRFYPARDGMEAWVLDEGLKLRYTNMAWRTVAADAQGAIANPTGGSVTDIEARAAITGVLQALRVHGVILE